jgi:hypothetical protein
MFGASAAYANGLMIKSDHNGTIFYNKYHRMNGDDWTCEPISPGSCNFFPQRQARDTVPLASELNGPQLLACKFDNGRNIQGVVLFFKLKLRIWYGDGGGEEWDGIDFSANPITTTMHGDRSLVLSGDLKHIIFNDSNEHAFGDCQPRSVSGQPLWWFNPILKQEWEYNAKP